jgi:hypothetical protein
MRRVIIFLGFTVIMYSFVIPLTPSFAQFRVGNGTLEYGGVSIGGVGLLVECAKSLGTWTVKKGERNQIHTEMTLKECKSEGVNLANMPVKLNVHVNGTATLEGTVVISIPKEECEVDFSEKGNEELSAVTFPFIDTIEEHVKGIKYTTNEKCGKGNGILEFSGIPFLEGGYAYEGTSEYIVNGKTLGKGAKVELQGQAMELGQLESNLNGTNIHIACNDAFGGTENVLEPAGRSKFEAEFKGCTVYTISGGRPENQPGCKTTVGTAKAKGELVESGIIEYTGSGASELFNEIEITEVPSSSKCGLTKGKYEIRGSQACFIPFFGFESTIGQVVCTGVGGEYLRLYAHGETSGTEAKTYARFAVTGTKGQTLGAS